MRLDDLDTPRIVPGAAQSIRDTLEACGLADAGTRWTCQSERLPQYHAALRHLCRAGLLYACRCSRRQLAGHTVYPGYCRHHRLDPEQLEERLGVPAGVPLDTALRVRLTGQLQFEDMIQGRQTSHLARDTGDVIVHRRDGIVAYTLAAAVDDSEGIDEVVRGADLLGSTAAQIALMQCLDRRIPDYAHLPVLVDANGAKLGKQTSAPAITEPLQALRQVWGILGQDPLPADSVTDFVIAAQSGWQQSRLPAIDSARVGANDGKGHPA